MKSMDDRSSQNMLESDLRMTFEQLWRELEQRERRAPKSVRINHKVCLDCTGELVDTESVDVVSVGHSALGAELIEFVCPRCAQPHKWFRFR